MKTITIEIIERQFDSVKDHNTNAIFVDDKVNTVTANLPCLGVYNWYADYNDFKTYKGQAKTKEEKSAISEKFALRMLAVATGKVNDINL